MPEKPPYWQDHQRGPADWSPGQSPQQPRTDWFWTGSRYFPLAGVFYSRAARRNGTSPAVAVAREGCPIIVSAATYFMVTATRLRLGCRPHAFVHLTGVW